MSNYTSIAIYFKSSFIYKLPFYNGTANIFYEKCQNDKTENNPENCAIESHIKLHNNILVIT